LPPVSRAVRPGAGVANGTVASVGAVRVRPSARARCCARWVTPGIGSWCRAYSRRARIAAWAPGRAAS
jgi:hypothetical protein